MKNTYSIFSFAFIMIIGDAVFSQSDSVQFTSSGTFTVPVGVTSITIEVVGAGGKGGTNGGGGGGGGGYAKGVYSVTPGSTLAINIASPTIGSTPDTTRVSTLIFATSGMVGSYVPNPNIGGGGVGGFGLGGTITNHNGGTGGGGYWTYFGGGGGGAAGSVSNGTYGGNTITWTGVCLTPGGTGGLGGGNPGGDGGKGAGFTDVSCIVTDPSGNGSNYGGGGGGGNGNGGLPGTGNGGYCKILWGVVTDVKQYATNNNLLIYPNPSNGKFLVENKDRINSMEIINLLGEIIYSESEYNKQTAEEIDLSAYPKGLYLLIVHSKENYYSEKILLY